MGIHLYMMQKVLELLFIYKSPGGFFDTALASFDVYTSAIIRIFDVIYNNKDIVTYTFDFQPVNGYMSYVQTLPITWTTFSDVPKFFHMFNFDKSVAFDVTAFYSQVVQILNSVSLAISTK